VTLYSSLFKKLPDPKKTPKNLFLNRLQFVKTAFLHDGKTSCFCGKETKTNRNLKPKKYNTLQLQCNNIYRLLPSDIKLPDSIESFNECYHYEFDNKTCFPWNLLTFASHNQYWEQQHQPWQALRRQHRDPQWVHKIWHWRKTQLSTGQSSMFPYFCLRGPKEPFDYCSCCAWSGCFLNMQAKKMVIVLELLRIMRIKLKPTMK